MSLVEKIREHESEFIAWRRELHSRPELGFRETATTAFIMEKLKSWGVEARPNGDKTGVIAEVRGALPGTKTVVLRADIDALPMRENTGLEFASKNDGVCHACGHDIHTAALLAAAYLLSRCYRGALAGTARFIFQPAEETLGGALSMIENGALDGADCVIGAHTWPDAEAGRVAVRKGPCLGSNDRFCITVRGKGGHAAQPDCAIDPVVVAAYIVAQLQTIVSRRVSPVDSAVVTVARIAAGAVYNVIPEDCLIEGSVRSLTPAVRDNLEKWITSIAKHTAEGMDAKAEVVYERGVPPTVNVDEYVDAVSDAVRELMGPGALKEIAEPSLGSEDFAYYLEKIPGAFIRLGTGDERPETHIGLHNPRHVFSEKAIAAGAAVYVGAAFKLTGSDMDALK